MMSNSSDMSGPDLSIASKRTVGRRIAANTGLMLGAKSLGVVLGLGSIWLATQSLSASELGYIFFLHAYMLFFSEVGTFQTWQAIIRFGTDDVKGGRSDRLAKLLSFGIRMDAVAALLAYSFSLLVFGIIPLVLMLFPQMAHGDGSVGGLSLGGGLSLKALQGYAAAYCVLILFRQRGTSIGLFRLFDKFNVLAGQVLVMPSVRFLGVAIAALMGAGFEGFLLAWFAGSFCAYIFLPILGFLELKRRNLVGQVIRAKINLRHPRKGLWRFVIKSNVDSTLAAADLNLPVLLVMAVFGSSWVAVYRIAEEIAKLLSEGFKLLDQVIYPELAKLVSQGHADQILRLVTRAALILLSFGGAISVFVYFAGPDILGRVFSKDYSEAAALTSLLVPAAALMGTAAPLYPVLYAADKPERAIYARGAGVLVYVLSFFILSATIGKMAPGWASILGNATGVLLVIFMARWTLKTNTAMQNLEQADEAEKGEVSMTQALPTVAFVGKSNLKLWGLRLEEWQRRAFLKAGAEAVNIPSNTSPNILMDVHHVLSPGLAQAFVEAPMTALIVDHRVVAIHAKGVMQAYEYIGAELETAPLERLGIVAKTPEDLSSDYNKALRKIEAPYALDTRRTSPDEIMKRQYATSYKGITDFITKFVWPVPAYYFTRLCAAFRISPNMVTTLSLIMTVLAMYYFWHGQWALGFLCGWFMTFLDTVDGKLARTTMTYSAWGNVYDHGIDLIHPPFWYWAWFVGLGGTVAASDPLTVALALIIGGYIVGRILEGIFLAQHGFYIHVWTRANSFMRFITARRNPNMFLFMIAILLSAIFPQAGVWGFFAVAAWTWFCNLFDASAIIVASFSKSPVRSWLETQE